MKLKDVLQRLPRGTVIFGSILLMSLLVRLLIGYEFHHSALLYVGIPTLISWLLLQVKPDPKPGSWTRKYWRHLLDALVVMFGSAMILFEGFLCVLMFLPIYLLMFFLTLTGEHLVRYVRKRSGSTYGIQLLPLLLVVASIEGVVPETSFDRTEAVSATRIVPLSVADIHGNLRSPVELRRDRHWFLELFPMPHRVEAEGLDPGDLHRLDLRYHRWFVTNTHAGTMSFEIVDSGANHISTRFVQDDTYLSAYLRLLGTEIRLDPVSLDSTQVTLGIRYERKLDPHWYFGPMQRYAVTRAAEFLIDTVVARRSGGSDE